MFCHLPSYCTRNYDDATLTTIRPDSSHFPKSSSRSGSVIPFGVGGIGEPLFWKEDEGGREPPRGVIGAKLGTMPLLGVPADLGGEPFDPVRAEYLAGGQNADYSGFLFFSFLSFFLLGLSFSFKLGTAPLRRVLGELGGTV